MRIAVGSAKGSPGVTCFALALAAVWPRPVLLVEADPAGGDLGARFGVPDQPGLTSLVVATRHAVAQNLWRAHAHTLPVSADVVIAPASALQARAAVAGFAARFPSADTDLILDVGRLSGASEAWPLVSSCDTLLLVSATDVASLDHTASLAGQLDLGVRLCAALVGEGSFPLAEMVDVLGTPVLATVPIDRRAAAVLTGMVRPSRGWTRFGVPAAARTATRALLMDVAAPAPPRLAPRLRVSALIRGGTP
jgi:hypothetical protein